MNNKTLLGPTLTLSLLVTTACSADMDGEGHPPNEQTANHRTLASIVTPAGVIRFEEAATADGNKLLLLSEKSQTSVSQSPLDRLLAKEPLTYLEIFLALSEEPPPQELIDAHDTQAELFDRESNDVHAVEFDLNAPIQKTSATCTSYVFPPNNSYDFKKKRYRSHQSGPYWMSMGAAGTNPPNDWSYQVYKRVTLGFCNDDAAGSSMTGRFRWNYGTGWIHSEVYDDIGPGWNYRVYPFSMTHPTCLTCGTRYGVYGNGTNYHLRTAELEPIVH